MIVDGQWGSWSSWTGCTKTCGEGRMTRTRECDSPSPSSRGETCPGDRSQSGSCPCHQGTELKNIINPHGKKYFSSILYLVDPILRIYFFACII